MAKRKSFPYNTRPKRYCLRTSRFELWLKVGL